MRVLLVLVGLMVASPASADTSIETHGIEVNVPANWGQDDKASVTVLAPKKLKGRGIEVRTLAAMPAATADALKKVLGEGLELTAKVVERQGLKVVQAEGKLVIQKRNYSVDLLVIPVGTGATVIASFLPTDEDAMLRDAYRKVLLSARIAGPKMTVTFTATKKKGVTGAPKAFVDGITRVVAGFDAAYRFPLPLPVKFEDCKDPNASYSSKDHEIIICHQFFDFFTELFTKGKVPADKIPELVSNAMLFFFLHEFGHAVVGEFNLPITGKGEDAADEIATLFLVNTPGDTGKNAALAGARAFQQMSLQGFKGTYWDVHSFNDQRKVEVVCLLYGANQKEFEPLMKDLKATKERYLKCPGQYTARAKAWNTHLAPHVRKKPKK